MHGRPGTLGIHASVSLLGVLATLAMAAIVAGSLTLHSGALSAADGCGGVMVGHLHVRWPPLAVPALLLGIAAARAASALSAHLAAARRARAALASTAPRALGELPFHVLDDPRPLAFCSGLRRPRVYVSRGTLERLGPHELRAVLAHERHHAARRDPLRRLLSDVLAQSLFFLPVLDVLGERRAALAELDADAAAVGACGGDVRPVAAALLAVAEDGSGALRVAPERVDRLAGIRSSWVPPLQPLLSALGTLTAMFALCVVTMAA